MTKKDFFLLIIKIFGLYWLISVLFSTLPSNIVFVIKNVDTIGIIWLLATFFISIGLFYLLIVKANRISKLLKLENGFDDDRINFEGLKSIDIIKFVVLMIGGLLFIENVPTFLSHTLFAFKSNIPTDFDQAYENQSLLKYGSIDDYVYWISSGFNLIIGYLLIVNFKKISNFLNKKNKE